MGGRRSGAGFVLELGDGSCETARRVLLATGMDYRYPALPGIESADQQPDAKWGHFKTSRRGQCKSSFSSGEHHAADVLTRADFDPR